MPLPLTVQSNTTCDVYRPGNAPPAAPDVAGVKIALQGDYARGSETREAESTLDLRWTHVALFPTSADVRDGFSYGTFAAGGTDTVYVPDKNGTPFKVAFVEGAGGCKRAYLNRGTPPWPTNYL